MKLRERLRLKEAFMFVIAFIFFLSFSGIVAKQPVEASERGIDYSDGNYRLSERLSRGQAAVILARALQLNLEDPNAPHFQDVNESSENYNSIAAIVSAGIFQGYSDGTFKPDQSLTRAEMAKILVVAYQFSKEELVVNPFEDVSSKSWYAPYLTPLIQNKVTLGTSLTTYSPNGVVTRGEMDLFISRCQQISQHLSERVIESELITITSDSVQLGNESFVLTDAQKAWITPDNLPLFNKSRIRAHIIGGKISRIESVTLNTSGQLKDEKNNPKVVLSANGAVIDATVILKGDDLSIKDATITRDLVIEIDAQNNFYLENVVVKGSTIVSKRKDKNNKNININRSQTPKLHFHKSVLQFVQVPLDRITLELTGGTQTNEINLLAEASIKADASTIIPIVRIGTGSLNTGLNARINSLFIENMNSRITLGTDAKIEDVRIELKNNVKSIFYDYELVKHKIVRINGVPNIEVQPPAGGGGANNGSSGTGEHSKLIAAQNAVASLFTDSTKTALKAGVDQAAIEDAIAKVALLADGVEKTALLEAIKIAQGLLNPILAAPALTGTIPKPDTVQFTFTDDAVWRDGITGIYMNGNSLPIHSSRVNKSTAGKIDIDLTGGSLKPGTNKFLIKAEGYGDVEVTIEVPAPQAAPVLTGTIPKPDTVQFTFTDDAVWRDGITGIYMNGNSLPIHSSRVNKSTAGKIDIDLTGGSLKPGTHQFLFKADWYEDVGVAIIIES
ncbi:S-layer homology domain-containing protein [Paenibacillus vini]|uniref:hemoblobin-interacting domain-containing protein n=1 Tax=Paenibacillus vini TaxID=1476024 RepID=UPI0025B6BB67|nr:S-layer homology domain-containing protein [Paenibacillus vini]MDN4068456.1 S-layer homology domain-containing protein [Paenibacillus vini]